MQFLPLELVRRFDDIFFIDLPHVGVASPQEMGARYEVFNLHLTKYFPAFQRNGQSPWTDDQWRRLLTEYRICTPAEIGNAVRRCPEESFYRENQGKLNWRIYWHSDSSLLQQWNGNLSRCRQFGIRRRMRDLPVGAIDQGLPISIKNFLINPRKQCSNHYCQFEELIIYRPSAKSA